MCSPALAPRHDSITLNLAVTAPAISHSTTPTKSAFAICGSIEIGPTLPAANNEYDNMNNEIRAKEMCRMRGAMKKWRRKKLAPSPLLKDARLDDFDLLLL